MQDCDNIIHMYPNKKSTEQYTSRFTQEHFNEHTRISKSRDNFEKWKSGVNFKTNRKIKIGGKLHETIKYDNFIILVDDQFILFNELDNINCDLYLDETQKIKKNVHEHNQLVDIMIIKINSLKYWNDYVEFNGIKYGIPIVHNNIHRSNDCFGNIVKDYHESCKCSTCEFWTGCGNMGTQYYACDKCNYTYHEKLEKKRTPLKLIKFKGTIKPKIPIRDVILK